VKPLPQFVRWSELAQPKSDRGFFFRQPSWPQPVNQNTRPIASLGGIVNAFEGNRHGFSYYPIFEASYASTLQMKNVSGHYFYLLILAAGVSLASLSGCEVERRKSDAELGLNPQQIVGRKLYDNYCDRCHEPYSTHGKKGPGLKGVFKNQYLPLSGLPANDDRVADIVKYGRAKMEGFGQVMTDHQIKDLIAYLHTL
jgi:mono/diheme cytochrome c family protein